MPRIPQLQFRNFNFGEGTKHKCPHMSFFAKIKSLTVGVPRSMLSPESYCKKTLFKEIVFAEHRNVFIVLEALGAVFLALLPWKQA